MIKRLCNPFCLDSLVSAIFNFSLVNLIEYLELRTNPHFLDLREVKVY